MTIIPFPILNKNKDHNKDEQPWAHIIRNKYMMKGKSIANMKRRSGDSNIWKGICAAVPLLKKGLKKVVRSGKDTCFWTDCWIGDKPLREWVIGPLNKQEEERKVRDFWTPHTRELGLEPDRCWPSP